ncbi:MAG: DNA-processing protein DprA [Xanthobacteraceae bacterium]|nr:DNA-processing protein DprA [Xanthobacteraceae bacterium]MBX3534296.1 DNA-processing protein DprA [Xanthobacteraceae bacterium]MCW5677447.1 DNA-processing protein DprA [Xanthobacteraceae bacterium]
MRNGDAFRLTDEQRIDWLRLIRAENVGPRTFRILINQFGGAGPAVRLLPELARRGGRSIINIPNREEAERELSEAARIGVRYAALGEADYPKLLREIDDPPPLLAIRGNGEIFSRPAIAMVGARNASVAGTRYAAQLARQFGEAGFAVISGLARGIDSAAHRAALNSGTVAVLAGGHAKPYPAENEKLLEALLEQGAAVSEMPHRWEPRARDFPRRNRLISGLAAGVVVVEAAERSGSLITARLAGEQGREVFAVPGSPADPRAGGTNRLIKQGATLVTSAADVIENLKPMLGLSQPVVAREPEIVIPAQPAPGADELRERLASLLSNTPVALDDLVREARASVGDVQVALFELELAGRIERHGGGMISLV